jgi:hypothetical protein
VRARAVEVVASERKRVQLCGVVGLDFSPCMVLLAQAASMVGVKEEPTTFEVESRGLPSFVLLSEVADPVKDTVIGFLQWQLGRAAIV